MARLPIRRTGDRTPDLWAQRLEILFGNTPTEIGVGTVISVLVTVSVWDSHIQQVLLAWLIAIFIIYAVRWGLGRIFRRSIVVKADRSGAWLALYLIGMAATGAAWGFLPIALAGDVTPYQLAFVLLWSCCLGVSTLAIYHGASYPPAVMGASAWLPPAAYYLFRGGDLFMAAAVMLIVFAVVLIGTAIGVNRTLNSNLRLRAENQRLSINVHDRKKQASALDTAVRASAANRDRLESELGQARTNLAAATHRLRALAATLVRVSPYCAVTSLMSHRYFLQTLDTEWRRSMRDRKPLSLVLFDFDDGESNSEFYRSAAGAKCLREIAVLAKNEARRAPEFAFRFDERRFGLLLPGADTGYARSVADRLREHIAAQRFASESVPAYTGRTVHAGIATKSLGSGSSAREMLQDAHSALAEANRQGGNRAVCFTDEERHPARDMPAGESTYTSGLTDTS